jgi:outer membrane protein TolC
VHINHDQVIRDLETDVRSAYIEALRSQEDIEAEEMSLERLRMLIQRIPPARSDLRNFLGVELAGGLQTLGASRQSLELAQGSLLQLLRLPSRPRLRLTSRLPAEIPEVNAYTVLEQGLVRRSDLQDARLRVEQAELALKQVGEYRKPSAGVFAYSGLSQSVHSRNRDYNSKSSYAAIMFNLNIPLFQWDWGMLNNQERSALLNLEQARDDLMEQQERASAELRQMLSSLSQVRQRLRSLPNPDLALEALASAEKSLLESSQWESAMAQVSNARHLWRSALSARIDALSDYYTVYLRLQRSVGEAPTVQ